MTRSALEPAPGGDAEQEKRGKRLGTDHRDILAFCELRGRRTRALQVACAQGAAVHEIVVTEQRRAEKRNYWRYSDTAESGGDTNGIF
jgi:hypothetical protein